MSHIKIVAGGTQVKRNELNVSALADLGYSILNDDQIFKEENSLLLDLLGKKQALFVISPTVYELYGEQVHEYLEKHLPDSQYLVSVLPSTEINKSMDTMLGICTLAKDFELDRDGIFVAVGGGIILDMVGFAASIYRRGTKYIKIPTTLVGQVDVSVGVKTGLNFDNSKNMLGTYYPAYATINDKNFLKSLSTRELLCGMAEVIKMGLVTDLEIFNQIESFYDEDKEGNIKNIDYEVFIQAMVRMIEELQPNLLEVELERLVDFGHTFSMRFETSSDHKLQHGEAVSIDMALSCCIAKLMGLMEDDTCQRIILLLKKTGLPIYEANCCTLENLQASIHEVCLHRNAVNLVIPTKIGQGSFIKKPEHLTQALLEDALKLLKSYNSISGIKSNNKSRNKNTQKK